MSANTQGDQEIPSSTDPQATSSTLQRVEEVDVAAAEESDR